MASHSLEVYGKGTAVWWPDDKFGWISAKLSLKEITGDNVKLVFISDDNNKELTITTTLKKLDATHNAELPPLRNPPMLEAVDDLTSLSYLNEPAVLIATNPFQPVPLYSQDIINAYSGKRRGELEPHVFAIAEDSYRCMILENKNQTIVVSGESGAGKTASAKYIMRYFASVDDKEKPRNLKKSSSTTSGMSEVEEQIMATNPIMESFGNAKTTRNDNSSRFGKYLEVEKKNLELGDYSQFHYLKQGGSGTINGVNDAEEFEITQKSLSRIGITIEVQWQIFRLCAALLHLGNIQITASRNMATVSDADKALITATKLLGIDNVGFKKWIVKKQLITRNEKIITDLNELQATVVRDSVAKYIYANLFDWLVYITNESLCNENVTKNVKSFIGVLDIYGFEHFKKNSFEQFCINYANEKLQQQFNQHVFKLEQEEYVREKINWTFIDFSDNKPCIELIEGKIGILSLLDEESRLPSGTDSTWCNKLYKHFDKPEYGKYFKKPRFPKNDFTICHYANDVTYDAENFLEKNKDTVPDEHLDLLKNTKFEFLEEIITKSSPPSSPTTPKPDAKRSSLAAPKKPTLGSIFKKSLINLMETISSTNTHYIRCIKPNEEKIASKFESQMVLSQLRACGVLETIRISCAGYPTRWVFDEFVQRYYMLIHSSKLSSDTQKMCLQILDVSIKDADKYQVGSTKLFFRAGMLAYLEKLRLDRLNECVILMQKNMLRHMHKKRYQIIKTSTIKIQSLYRRNKAMKELQRLREQTAAIKIQKYWRGYVQRKRYLLIRGIIARKRYQDMLRNDSATKIQAVYPRREYKRTVKHVIFVQSCLRRRMARSELKKLKIEARSATHLKEVSYKLENKVIELTQSLEQKVQENKNLELRTSTLESQIKSILERYEKLENDSKKFKNETSQSTVKIEEFKVLQAEKETLESRYRTSLDNIKKQDLEIQKITSDNTKKDEEITKLRATNAKYKGTEDPAAVLALKQEIANLREQLAKVKSASMKGTPTPPTSNPRQETSYLTNGSNTTLKPPSTQKRKNRRHSFAESWGPTEVSKRKNKTSTDLIMAEGKKGSVRPVSISYTQMNIPKIRAPGGRIHLSDIEDDPEDEIMKLLEDEEALDEEVINGLIKSLKIPLPSLQNPPSQKEILFPARLITLLAKQMWKLGYIKESERLFANVMKTIQEHVMDFEGDDAILPGAFWLSNVHELLSFANASEKDMLRGVNPAEESGSKDFVWHDYERLVSIVKHDLESLEYNIYHTWMKELKKRLYKMIIPAVIESQSLPGFITSESRFIAKFITGPTTPAFSMDDLLNFLNKVWKSMKSYYVELTVVQQVVTELLKLIGVTSFNDLLMRRSFCSWKRAMQIQYNITRIEEWCKSHEMPEGTLQLEHLMQATKLLQLKKATPSDIEIIYDVCWMLTPTQIQKLINHYFNPISPEILKAVASRVVPNDKNDILLLDTTPLEDSGPFEVPTPRETQLPDNYLPAWLNLPHLKRIGVLSAGKRQNFERYS
ncbi:11776_t:CDS:10 [Entrophospora sp. SA101]|nr:11776_t:CDS:10 [Entrophospora sp. SA101]